ncbi:MAG TPA: PAS domain S-box protein, partial [Rhodanobacteraceae bacterium]|nr:PAS domain S-box protein [Rhodanobacteraceae bacterium]
MQCAETLGLLGLRGHAGSPECDCKKVSQNGRPNLRGVLCSQCRWPLAPDDRFGIQYSRVSMSRWRGLQAAPDGGDKMAAKEKVRPQSDKYYELLFIANPAPMWVFEIDGGRFLAVNAQACEQYGYSEEEFLAMTIFDIRPAGENEHLESVRSTGRSGHRNLGIWKHRKKDGTLIDVEITSDDIVFQGKQSRLVLINDVTERNRIEAAWRLSHERFKYVTRATEDAVWDRNIAENTIWWNDGLRLLFGIPHDEVEGTIEWARERIHPDDRDRVADSMEAVIKSRDDQWSTEYRFRRHDGSYAFVYDRGFVIRGARGRAVRVVGAMTDLSDRKKREDRLREQATLLDRATDAILVRGMDRRIRYWNKAA